MKESGLFDFLSRIADIFLNYPFSTQLIRVGLIVILGLPFIKITAKISGNYAKKNYSLQTQMILKKIIYFGGFFILMLTVLNEFGFKISAILGAAGIFGIAIGFASQTSFANIISGLFLISEKPFLVGDIVQINNTMGIVLSIDFLSIKLRTFDNRFVRIPNETVIKSESINISKFPIRRLDLDIGVAYKEDIRSVIQILKEIASENPYCLDEPEPVIYFFGFGDSALQIKFCLWFEKTELLKLRNSILIDIKERFDKENIEIPFPHVTVYSGEETKAFPLTVKSEKR